MTSLDANSDRLREAIQKAEAVVGEVHFSDHELKVAAFSKLVEHLLGEMGGKEHADVVTTTAPAFKPELDLWQRLEERSGIMAIQLKDVFDLRGDQVEIITRIKEKRLAEGQRNLSMLVLFAYQYGLGLDWVDNRYLVEAAKRAGLYDSNFSKITEFDLFKGSGSKRGRKYRLSNEGFNETLAYLRRLTSPRV